MATIPDSFILGLEDKKTKGDIKNMPLREFNKCAKTNKFSPKVIENLKQLRTQHVLNVSKFWLMSDFNSVT